MFFRLLVVIRDFDVTKHCVVFDWYVVIPYIDTYERTFGQELESRLFDVPEQQIIA